LRHRSTLPLWEQARRPLTSLGEGARISSRDRPPNDLAFCCVVPSAARASPAAISKLGGARSRPPLTGLLRKARAGIALPARRHHQGIERGGDGNRHDKKTSQEALEP